MGVFLDLDERADFRVVADRASVEVDELGELDVLPEFDGLWKCRRIRS